MTLDAGRWEAHGVVILRWTTDDYTRSIGH